MTNHKTTIIYSNKKLDKIIPEDDYFSNSDAIIMDDAKKKIEKKDKINTDLDVKIGPYAQKKAPPKP